MKKTYFEPETKVSEMVTVFSIMQSSNTGLSGGEVPQDGEDANKRNTGRDATWGNLW